MLMIMHMMMFMVLTSRTLQHMQMQRFSLMAVQHGSRAAQA
jgi:hypothetical protein